MVTIGPGPFPRAPWVALRAGVRGSASARVDTLEATGRRVVLVHIDPETRRGALTATDSATLASGARLASAQRLPLVVRLDTSGADIDSGVSSLHGWGEAARALAGCSGVVPVIVVVSGLAVSGPALMLGMADLVVMTPDAVAYVSGPASVAALTGFRVDPEQLGGQAVHARTTGVAALLATNVEDALDLVADVLDFLPDHVDQLPPVRATSDDADRPTPELRYLLPAHPSGSYDVRLAVVAIGDDGLFVEIRERWAPQLVTGLIRVDGQPVGVVANQPQSMAGTLDIAASQKGARFVSFCDTFNVPVLTLVDTPGFMPGKDLEWRGMIRHGAQLVFAYAEATVPRVCLIMRKAFGGAYIVMDSKLMGNDLCLAWPSAQVAVMGAPGAVQILHRREDAETQAQLIGEYQERFLNPYVAAERGYIDQIVDPAETRAVVARAFAMLANKAEQIPARKHANGPL
ncbi:MAG: methylmalonyl-CoA carboxyltransferase [Actinomycetota bacterium]|nr:methylmalonyl-CoA carboxyltransferase [Actinomycetota bacterium]